MVNLLKELKKSKQNFNILLGGAILPLSGEGENKDVGLTGNVDVGFTSNPSTIKPTISNMLGENKPVTPLGTPRFKSVDDLNPKSVPSNISPPKPLLEELENLEKISIDKPSDKVISPDIIESPSIVDKPKADIDDNPMLKDIPDWTFEDDEKKRYEKDKELKEKEDQKKEEEIRRGKIKDMKEDLKKEKQEKKLKEKQEKQEKQEKKLKEKSFKNTVEELGEIDNINYKKLKGLNNKLKIFLIIFITILIPFILFILLKIDTITSYKTSITNINIGIGIFIIFCILGIVYSIIDAKLKTDKPTRDISYIDQLNKEMSIIVDDYTKLVDNTNKLNPVEEDRLGMFINRQDINRFGSNPQNVPSTTGFRSNPTGLGSNPGINPGFGSTSSFGSKPTGFGSNPTGFGSNPTGFGSNPTGFGSNPTGFGSNTRTSSNPFSGGQYPENTIPKISQRRQNLGSSRIDTTYLDRIEGKDISKLLEDKKYKEVKKYLDNYGNDFSDYFKQNLKNTIIPLYFTIILSLGVIIVNARIKKIDDTDNIIYTIKIIYYWMIIFTVIIILTYVFYSINTNNDIDNKVLLILFLILIFTIFGGIILLQLVNLFEKSDTDIELDTKDVNINDKLKKISIYGGISLVSIIIFYLMINSTKKIPNSFMIIPIIFFSGFMGFEIYNIYGSEIKDITNKLEDKLSDEYEKEDNIDEIMDTLFVDKKDEKYSKYVKEDDKVYTDKCMNKYLKKSSLIPTHGPVCNKNYINNTVASKVVDSLF